MFGSICSLVLFAVIQTVALNCDIPKSYAWEDMPVLKDNLFKIQDKQELTLTCYTPDPKENWKGMSGSAFGTALLPGTIAVSRDLYKKGWKRGRKVRIVGHGTYRINDLMNKRHKKRVDILVTSKKRAKDFGVQKARAILLSEVEE